MNEVSVILLSTIIPIIISGIVTVIGIVLQAYLTRKYNNKDIKFELLSKINNEILESYDLLLKNDNEIPERNATANEVSDFFTENMILVYKAKKEEFKNINTIFNKAKIILSDKDNQTLNKEFQKIKNLDFNLFASALSNSLGGVDTVREKGIEINDDIKFISADNYQSSIREYIDLVSALKNRLTIILEKYMKKLLK